MDVLQNAEQYAGRDTTRMALNFAYSQGLTVLHYNPVNDWWHLSDGEIYTTRAIMKEARN